MSQPKRQLFTCPHCGCKQEFGVWDNVNATQDPALKEQLLKRELGKFTCENCAGAVWVRHPIQYHDVAGKFMIWLPHGDAQTPPLTEGTSVMNLMAGSGYIFRVVDSYNELIEKIRVFDDRQDDRAIEALKLAVATEKKLGADEMLFYNGLAEVAEGRKTIKLTAVSKQGQLAYQVPLEELKKYAPKTQPGGQTAKWLKVDRAYAVASSKS